MKLNVVGAQTVVHADVCNMIGPSDIVVRVRVGVGPADVSRTACFEVDEAS